MTPRSVLVLLGLLSATAATAAAQAPAAPLGSRDNPVRAEGPPGEREYLTRLRCPSGTVPNFERIGSFEPGADGHILDGYEVLCDRPLPEPDTVPREELAPGAVEIFMDMYHDGYREMAAVPGFTVLPNIPARVATGCPPRVAADPDSAARYVFSDLEVERPVHLSREFDVDEPVQIGHAGRAYVEFVVDTVGRPEPASLNVRFITDEALRPHIAAALARIPLAAAEHHPGCKVRQRLAVPIEFR
jgi:hypothetical protein